MLRKGIDDLLAAGGTTRLLSDVEFEALLGPVIEAGKPQYLDLLERRAKHNPGVLLESDTLDALANIKQNRKTDWLRVRKLAKRLDCLKLMEEALKERATGTAVVETVGAQTAVPQTAQPSGPWFSIGKTYSRVVLQDGRYEEWSVRTDPQTHLERIVRVGTLTNWSFDVNRTITYRNGNGEAKNKRILYEGRLRVGDHVGPFRLEDTDLSDPRLLKRALQKGSPVGIITNPGMEAMTVQAINHFNRGIPNIDGVTSIGYLLDERNKPDHRIYVMPSMVIRDGVMEPNLNHPVVPQSERGSLLNLYDFRQTTLAEAEAGVSLLMHTVLKLHHPRVMLSLLAAMVGSVMTTKMEWERHSVYLEGRLQAGKTKPCRALLNLFADVPVNGEGGLVSALSTYANITWELSQIRDAPTVVDDVKMDLSDLKGIIALLQSIMDGTSKGRMTAQMEKQRDYIARGQVIFNGEELPGNVASAISRMLLVSVDNVGFDASLLGTIHQYRHYLRGIMPHFIGWLQHQTKEELTAPGVAELTIRNQRGDIFGRQMINTIWALFRFIRLTFPEWRVGANLQLLASYYAQARDHIVEVVELTGQRGAVEAKEQKFVHVLTQMIDSGKLDVSSSLITSNQPIVGRPFFNEDGRIFILVSPDVACSAVTRECHQQYNRETLGQYLMQEGTIVPNDQHQPGIRIPGDGRRANLWCFPAETLLSPAKIQQLISLGAMV